jgi:hypothetical protein
MKNRYLFFWGFIMAMGVLSGCSKDAQESCPICHELLIPPQLTPMQKDYRVGDTIELVLNLPFMQTHPAHYRPVNLSGFEPANIPIWFLYYEQDATKTLFYRKSGYTVNQYEVLVGEDKGYQFSLLNDLKRFLPAKKSDAYELRLRVVLKQPGYFSIGTRYGQYRVSKSSECFSVTYPFDTTMNNNFIQLLVGHSTLSWVEDFFFRVLP